MKLTFISGIFALILTSFSSNKLPLNFTDQLERGGLVFQMPENFKEVPIIQNRHMNYEYAIKHKKKNFEVRFAIRPLDHLLEDYNQKEQNKKSGDINIHPNQLFKSLMQVTLLNISGQLPEIEEFGKEAVKKEFNADWGAVTFVEVRKEFGQKYKYCMIVALHKENVADAYIFFLSDKSKGFEELMNLAFYSLKFK